MAIIGDMNVQPMEPGAGPDLKAKQGRRWSRFLMTSGVTLLNPSLQGAEARPVWLPLRNKYVSIRLGDTHHCAGQSRAIDLAVVSDSVDAGRCADRAQLSKLCAGR